MTFTFTISLGLAVVLTIWVALFFLTTLTVYQAGFFDGDRHGVGKMFAFIFYLVLWLLPSLVATLVWSLWFR